MEEADRLAKIIWDFHHMGHKLRPADVIFTLGSHDLRVAERAAQLYHQGFAPLLIFSGGIAHTNDSLSTGWDRPEADVFAKAAIEKGVPDEKILREREAKNTGENVAFTKKLLEEKNIDPKLLILVQKPYMERRTFATFKKVWPEKEFLVTSPQFSYEEYISERSPRDMLINIMVGDLQRIIEYPKKGFQIEQGVPEEALDAYNKLISFGYTKHLIK